VDQLLAETYGVFVYQEQVMRTAQRLSGYTQGEADFLRKAMGKKDPVLMAEHHEKFIAGAGQNGVERKLAGELFKQIEKFARYGFNKSHSVAYALITYQTAYLKLHHPIEFLAAMLTNDQNNTGKVVRYISSARNRGIPVLPPDVNKSRLVFGVSDKTIRFGLGAVKGVGEAAVAAILKERDQNGEFKGLFDFCERVDLRKVTKKTLEALIHSGALDFTGAHRAAMIAVLEKALEHGQITHRAKTSGQAALFGKSQALRGEIDDRYPNVERFSPKEILALEKSAVGFYITGHPLDQFKGDLKRLDCLPLAAIGDSRKSGEATAAGVVNDLEVRTSKAGRRWAQFILEDLSGIVRVRVLGDLLAKSQPLLESDRPLVVQGRVVEDGEGDAKTYSLMAREISLLSALRADRAKRVIFHLPADAASRECLKRLRELLTLHEGSVLTEFLLHVPKLGQVILKAPEIKISPCEELFDAVEKIFGEIDGARYELQ
jgi:DNA polymerase-3 subunit alpha